MASYRRTQILLEPWQYATLKALAEREGVSISEIVRRILTRQFRSGCTRRRGLQTIAGLGRDGKAAGRHHNRWLYGPGARA